MPDSLHTDQGTNLYSQLLNYVCTLLGVDKTMTSAFYTQGNGKVERHNRVVADMLPKYCANNPRIWDRLVPYLTFLYKTTVHKTTGPTPFSLIYGAECQYPIDLFYPRQPGAKSLTMDLWTTSGRCSEKLISRRGLHWAPINDV